MVVVFAFTLARPTIMDTTEPSPPDPSLVERIQTGDDRALGIVYDRYAPLVLGVARSILKEESDAEEIAEIAFMHLWENAGDFDPSRGSLRTYLAMIARSRALDRLRAVRRRHEAMERSASGEPELFAAPVSNPGSHPERALEQDRTRAALEGLMTVLSNEQREAIELAFFGGLTQSEIARQTETPLGTVKTRIRDGMSKLRETAGARRLKL